MFGMTSIFVNLSETMAETGFLVGDLPSQHWFKSCRWRTGQV